MPNYATNWFATAITKHSTVQAAHALPNGHVTVEREDLTPVTIAPLAHDRVDTSLVIATLADGDATIMIPVRRDAHYDWPARDHAERHGSTVHTYMEMMSSLANPDPRNHIDRNVEFATARLRQHSAVRAVEMVCEAMFTLERYSLGPLTVAVAYEYEMTEEALVRAIERHPEAKIIYNANPNGRTTASALEHAHHTSMETYRFADLMRRVGRD